MIEISYIHNGYAMTFTFNGTLAYSGPVNLEAYSCRYIIEGEPARRMIEQEGMMR